MFIYFWRILHSHSRVDKDPVQHFLVVHILYLPTELYCIVNYKIAVQKYEKVGNSYRFLVHVLISYTTIKKCECILTHNQIYFAYVHITHRSYK